MKTGFSLCELTYRVWVYSVVTLSKSKYLKIKIGLSLYSGSTFIIPNGILFNIRADAWMVAGRGEAKSGDVQFARNPPKLSSQ